MQEYVYVRSPLQAAQLLEQGFSYIRTPMGRGDSLYVFEATPALLAVLQEQFTVNEDYIIRSGALINF